MSPKNKGENGGKPAKVQAIAVPEDSSEIRGSISRMLGFLKYRADPEKNKKGEGREEAVQALEALLL